MSGDENGRVRLSWAQIVWAVATLAAIIGSWYDTRTQIDLVRNELKIRTEQRDQEHVRMWKAIDEANAAERPRPRR